MKKYFFIYAYLLTLLTHLHCAANNQRGSLETQDNQRTQALYITGFSRMATSGERYGSFLGGTQLSISGYGFDRSNPQNNKVFFGDYPCQVSESTRQKIICETSPYSNSVQSIIDRGFNLKVFVGTASASYTTAFSYLLQYTPRIRKVYPATVFGPTTIKIWGIHKMTTIGDGNRVPGENFRVSVGNTACGRSGMSYQYLSMDYYRFLTCNLEYTMEAGKYNLTHWVGYGYPYHQKTMKKQNLHRNQTFEMTILPAIYKISPASGTGQILNINGTGFVSNISRIKVEVDGRNCEIRQAETNRIQCRLNERREGPTSRLLTNTTSTQKLGYIAGSGWNYSRYLISYSGEIRNVRTYPLNLSSLSIHSIKSELQCASGVDMNSFLDVYKGYFKAPRSGAYRFKGFGQKKFALFISHVYGSVEMNANQTPVIWSNSETKNDSHVTFMTDKIISNQIFMEEGKYYYMQLYHSHDYYYYSYYISDGGYLKISAEVPNNNSQIPGQVYAVHRFTTKFSPDPEIIEFTQEGASEGSVTLSISRLNSNFVVYYSCSISIAYNQSIATFLSKLRSCSGYMQYPIDGTREVYDESGINITNQVAAGDQSRAYRFVWRVFVNRLRAPQHIAEIFEVTYNIIGSQFFIQQIIQEFSPLITGTFQIEIGGILLPRPTSNNTPTGFPYNVTAPDLQLELRKIQGLENLKVQRQGNPSYSANWTIFYEKFAAEPPLPIFHTSNLEGGAPGTAPTIQLIQMQTYKTRINIDVIDHEFMFQPSDRPKVLVTIDNYLVSTCPTAECGYVYNQAYPKVSMISFSGTNPIVNFTLNISSGFNVNISNIDIKQKNSGSLCIIMPAQTLPTFRCMLETNQDFSPRLYAGSIIFEVFARGVGYLEINSGLNLQKNLAITFITPTQGSEYGGFNLTIVGRGFHDYDLNLINVTMCNQRAQILEASNIMVILNVPSCNSSGNATVYIQSGNQSVNTQVFVYQPPQASEIPIIISSISPSSVNPTIKIPLKINGSGFGNNSALLTITIRRNDGKKWYRLKILKLNDTCMQVGFPGSLPGRYRLNIKKIENSSVTLSRATAEGADFITVGVFITSIWPITGSPFGGTELTIVGENFSPDDLDTIVNIGEKPNTFCELLSFNTTLITCRTPPQPDSYSNRSQTVFVTTKLIDDAYCTNSTGCQFTYTASGSYSGPLIVKLLNNNSGIFNLAVENVMLQTANQSSWPANYFVVIKNAVSKKEHVVPRPYVTTSTALNFTLPQIESGLYQMFIRTSEGHSNSVYMQRAFSTTSTEYRMTQKGGVLLIDGIGLPEDISSSLFKFQYQYSSYPSNIKCELVATSPSKMALMISTPNYLNGYEYGALFIQAPFTKVRLSLTFMKQLPSRDIFTYNITNGSVNFLLTNSSFIDRVRIISKSQPSIYYDITQFNYSNSKINFSCALPAGAYNLWANYHTYIYRGWYDLATQINITRPNISIPQPLRFGKNGVLLQLPNTTSVIGNTTILWINGQKAKYSASIMNSTYFYIPPFVAEPTPQPGREARNLVSLLESAQYSYSFFSDIDTGNTSRFGSAAYDYDRRDYYQSSNQICYAGINITAPGVGFRLSQIYLQVPDIDQSQFKNIQFEGFTQGRVWEKIVTIPRQNVQTSYLFGEQDYHEEYERQVRNINSSNLTNITLPSNISSRVYSAIRLIDRSRSSRCSPDYISLTGWLVSSPSSNNSTNTTNSTNSNSSNPDLGPFNLEIDDGFNFQTIPNIIYYSDSCTPVVGSVEPKTGHYLGGYNLTIRGSNLQGSANVTIDGIPCAIIQSNQTSIICLVQQRPEGITTSSFEILVNGSFAKLQSDGFKYVLRWSDERTWGMSFKPVDGDLVHVPKGQILWVDESTPKLVGIVVQGKIVFSDEVPMTITTDFITINKGEFVAGTPEKPYQNLLKFRLTGWQRTPRQPIFGTKVIGCEACKLSMHAKGLANFRWALLNQTIFPNMTNMSLDIFVPDDYANNIYGSKILVTSTSSNYKQMEIVTLGDTSSGTLSTQQAFQYKHLSTTIEGKKISAQVGLLSSNIVIEGVDSYETERFGAKIVMRGEPSTDNSYLQISNIEMTKCGQPNVYGQHCITVLNSGPSGNSYIKDSSIYNTYSRGIHFSNQIMEFTVEGNLIFNTTGHSIEFQSTMASNNLIKSNLIVSPRVSWQMTQKDATPAAMHLTSPSNIIQGNHLAGGKFFGIWFDLQSSRSGSKCGSGMKYHAGSADNIIHGFQLAGVLIDELAVTSLTCYYSPYYSDSYPSGIRSYTFYRNAIGLSLVRSNYVTLSELLFIQNGCHLSLENANIYSNSSKLINSSFHGILDETQRSSYSAQVFVQLPCSDGFNISMVNFTNNNVSTDVILRGCIPSSGNSYSRTDHVHISKIRYINVSCLAVLLQYDRLTVIYDSDGTFTQNAPMPNNSRLLLEQNPVSMTVIPNFSYLTDPACFNENENNSTTTLRWTNVYRCNSSVKIRTMQFRRQVYSWQGGLHIGQISDFNSSTPTDWFILSYRGSISQIPFIMNRYYEIFIQRSFYYDFEFMELKMIGIYQPGDGTLVFKHKYQRSRELYEVKIYENGRLSPQQNNTQSGNFLNVSTCNIGDFYHDNNQSLLGLCLSDRNMRPSQSVQVYPIFCRYECPSEEQQQNNGGCQGIQETRYRLWSNASMWPNQTLPVDGNNVTIKKEWKVILDMNPAKINYLLIQGTLIIPDQMNETVIEANMIWVQGSLKAGNSSLPYYNKLTIRINGGMNNFPMNVDVAESGNKMIVVTGLLSLYGNAPSTVWTRLLRTTLPGNTSMQVVRNIGWSVGDLLVIGPSFTNSSHSQYVTITSISGNEVTFEPALNYTHYGAAGVTTQQRGQQIDARAVVGHLTRNIRIVSGNSTSWGYRILTYGYSECNGPKIGVLKLSGVELKNGGQPYPVYNKPMPAIHLKKLTAVQVRSQILSSSIHHCNSRCIIVDGSNDVKINNNIIASATNMHIQMVGLITKALVTFNAMIDAHHSQGTNVTRKVACMEWLAEVYKSTTVGTVVSNNVCQGSQGAGFVRYISECTKPSADSVYDRNQVGSADIGYLLLGQKSCMVAQNMTAYGCRVGLAANPRSSELLYRNIAVIDSDVGVALRSYGRVVDQAVSIRNSYISMAERTNCTECYGQGANTCINSTGVLMLVSTEQSKWSYSYSSYYSAELVNQFSQASFDSKSFIINSSFANYKLEYNEPALAGKCANNRVLMAPPAASELIGSHHFHNTTCSNCEMRSITKFTESSLQEVGELKPCGEFACTGRQNYFIEDHTGHLLNRTGSLVSSSQALTAYLNKNGTSEICQQVEEANALLCDKNYTFYVLQFQSLSQNENDSKVLWPVYITSFNMSYWVETYYDYNYYNNTDDSNSDTDNSTSAYNSTYNSSSNSSYNASAEQQNIYPYLIDPPEPEWIIKLNANKEWQYNPATMLPRYTRLNRFNSLILANDTYNITFNSTPPRSARFQFQKRSNPVTDTNDWAILKVYYPIPNSIRVQVGSEAIQPITVLENNIEDPLINMTDVCGANKYYFKHRTMDFVINSNPNCRPILTITNSIQLTAKFMMSIDQFYQMDGKTKFIHRMAALLGITDYSRIKIVGIYRGSVVIQSFVDDGRIVNEENATAGNVTQQINSIQQISQILSNLYSSGQMQTALASAGFGPVIVFSTNVMIYDTPETYNSSSPSNSSTNQQTNQNTDEQTIQQNVEQSQSQSLSQQESPAQGHIKGTAVNIGLIVGIAVGAVVALVLAGFILYMRRKNKIANEIMDIQLQKSDDKILAKKQEIVNNSNWSIVDLQ